MACHAPAMANGCCHKHGGRGAEARQAARNRSEARKVLAALDDLLRGL